jgi:hypothetical protein
VHKSVNVFARNGSDFHAADQWLDVPFDATMIDSQSAQFLWSFASGQEAARLGIG